DVRPATGGAVGWVAVERGGQLVGGAGPLEADAPVWAAPLFGFEVRLAAAQPDLGVYRPLPLQPPVERDLALVLPPGVTAAQVSDVLRRTVGPLLERLEVFDEYRGPGIPAGHRSVAWHCTFRDPERRLRACGSTTSSRASRFSRSKRATPAATEACALRAAERRRVGAPRVPAAGGLSEHQEARGQGDDRRRGVYGALRPGARVHAGSRRIRGPGAEEGLVAGPDRRNPQGSDPGGAGHHERIIPGEEGRARGRGTARRVGGRSDQAAAAGEAKSSHQSSVLRRRLR